METKKSKNNLGLSRVLRKNQTPWENKLWQHLKAKRFYNLKFKRQVRIGNYIVDFCCYDKKLIIELDGGQHGEDDIYKKDLIRDRYLKSEGYTILRVWNNDIDNNLDGVMDKIGEVCDVF